MKYLVFLILLVAAIGVAAESNKPVYILEVPSATSSTVVREGHILCIMDIAYLNISGTYGDGVTPLISKYTYQPWVCRINRDIKEARVVRK